MHTVDLPQGKITFSPPMPDDIYTLIGGGRPPSIDWLQTVATHPLWAIDHGLDISLAADLKPDLLIGDGDSASADNWKKARSLGIPIEKFPVEKDFTDTQLALHMLKKNTPAILFTGVFGGRLDHLMSTVFSFADSDMRGILADERECCILLRDGECVTYEAKKRPLALSLLALSDTVTGVSLEGTRWELSHSTLRRDTPYAISNVLSEENNRCTVSIKEGCLLFYIVEARISATR